MGRHRLYPLFSARHLRRRGYAVYARSEPVDLSLRDGAADESRVQGGLYADSDRQTGLRQKHRRAAARAGG